MGKHEATLANDSKPCRCVSERRLSCEMLNGPARATVNLNVKCDVLSSYSVYQAIGSKDRIPHINPLVDVAVDR